MSSFAFNDMKVAYTEFGGGPAALTPAGKRGRAARSSKAVGRPLIIVHGLLLSQRMGFPLAEDLAARGNRVITVDLLGHGRSDRPRDMWRYSMSAFEAPGDRADGSLGAAEAAVMGTSLGANTALEVASAAPERLRAMVIEMPALDNALLAERGHVHADPAGPDLWRAGDEGPAAGCQGGSRSIASLLRGRPARPDQTGPWAWRRGSTGAVLRSGSSPIVGSGARSRLRRW